MITYTIDGELTDLNTYIRAERGNRFSAAKIKKNNTWMCQLAARNVAPVTTPFNLRVKWITPNEKKDPDNTAFAVKFVLDGLKDAGVIKNDGRKQVLGIAHEFAVDSAKPRVEVVIE